MNLTLEALLGSVSLVRGDHLDEAEAARLLRVRVTHDVALLHLAILLEQALDLLLAEARVDASYEEIGAWVAAVVVSTVWRRATSLLSAAAWIHHVSIDQVLPAVAIVGRSAASARIVQVATVTARRTAAVAVVASRLVYASVSKPLRATAKQGQSTKTLTVVATLVRLVLHRSHDDTSVGRWTSGVVCRGWAGGWKFR